VHRDIKPENVLISQDTEDGKVCVKLTDFGFATFCNPVEGLQQRLGSPMYMAPEIVKLQPYNCKVDVWSIGVITHVLLTGCPPFFGKTKESIFDAVCNRQPAFGRVKDQLSASAIDFTL